MKPRAAAALVEGDDCLVAARRACAQVMASLGSAPVDLVVLFASATYAPRLAELTPLVRQTTSAALLVGCSGQAIIGIEREVEDRPAISLLALSLPGARLSACRLTRTRVNDATSPTEWQGITGVSSAEPGGWLVFADPFRMDAELLVSSLSAAYPDRTILGGVASGDYSAPRTYLFLDDEIYTDGAVLVHVGGAVTLQSVVSQGCEPIGQPWTITSVDHNLITTIANQPALDILVETLETLPEATRQRAQQNLLVGLAIDEYQADFRRGDFLIRNLLGIDRRTGALVISALPRPGQTVQFQMRDAEAADAELRLLLDRARHELGARSPVAALLCICNGRGRALFDMDSHDARAVADTLGPLPAAGFFCNGEIGPVGKRTFVHGFTASIGLVVSQASRPELSGSS